MVSCSLKQYYIGYENTTVLAILTHFYSTYIPQKSFGHITNAYKHNLLIDMLLNQIKDVVAYANQRQDLLMMMSIVNWAFMLVLKNVIFAIDCREWKDSLPQNVD